MDLDEIKSRINPQYKDCPGTESYERKWLCDEIEQLRQRVQELEFELAETEALEISHGDRIEKLMKAIEELYFGYVRLMENGRDRIMMLGGDCDSLQYMEENDPLLIETRKIFK